MKDLFNAWPVDLHLFIVSVDLFGCFMLLLVDMMFSHTCLLITWSD